MQDLVGRICAGITRMEGHSPSYTNPGSLRWAPWLKTVTTVNGFWSPVSRAQGMSGMHHVVSLAIARGETLRQLLNAWAPASDGNKPDVYLANVLAWTGIENADVPLEQYLEFPAVHSVAPLLPS